MRKDGKSMFSKPNKILHLHSKLLHDVCDDPDAPEVCVEGDGLVVDHLGGHELGSAQHFSHLQQTTSSKKEYWTSSLQLKAHVLLFQK